MSLFIGNIAKDVKPEELEEEFKKFGKCYIRPKVPTPPYSIPLPPLSTRSVKKQCQIAT
jgi:hypothetical protein